MANCTKRDESDAKAVRASEGQVNVRDVPSLFRCSVCGVEVSSTVPIMAVSAGLQSAFYCREHVPREWR
jgi:hypothetical protein